jgi:hypothetical protein
MGVEFSWHRKTWLFCVWGFQRLDPLPELFHFSLGRHHREHFVGVLDGSGDGPTLLRHLHGGERVPPTINR